MNHSMKQLGWLYQVYFILSFFIDVPFTNGQYIYKSNSSSNSSPFPNLHEYGIYSDKSMNSLLLIIWRIKYAKESNPIIFKLLYVHSISYHCYNISFILHFLFQSHLSILSSIQISFHHFLQSSHFFSPSDSFPFSSLFEIRRICIHGAILLYYLFYRNLLFFSLFLLLLNWR